MASNSVNTQVISPEWSGTDLEFEARKTIIASLCSQAPSTQIRDCIRLYVPTSSTSTIKKDMERKFKKTDLAQTLSYLHINSVEPSDKKDDIIHKIICRIQNLFPDDCKICGEEYCSQLDDLPFLACEKCGQEAHRPCFLKKLNLPDDSYEVNINPLALPGIHYLCPPCESDTIPSNKNAMKMSPKKVEKTSAENEPDVKLRNPPNPIDLTTVLPENDTKNLETNDIKASNLETKLEKNQETNQKNATQMCQHYSKKRCKHGISGKDCKFLHPKPCNKFMRHGTRRGRGCSLGKKCTRFHPPMCQSSIIHNQCFTFDCPLNHVKGTLRNNQFSEISKNNPNQPIPLNHVKGTLKNNQFPEISKNNSNKPTPLQNYIKIDQNHPKISPHNTDNTQIPLKDYFLDVVTSMKTEIMLALDTKLAMIMSQIPQSAQPKINERHFQQQVYLPSNPPPLLNNPRPQSWSSVVQNPQPYY